MKKEKSEGKLKLTKEQEEEVIKKGVMAMTKIIERLEEENKKLREEGVRLLKENSELEKKVKEQYYEIQQYEKGFANGSWHGDDEY